MYVYTVTIGRNVGDIPMSDERWSQFQEDVYSDVRYALDVPAEAAWDVHNGIGIWKGEWEPSHKLAVLLNHAANYEDVEDLRSRLSELARHYDQDAIALTIGISELC